MASTELTFAEDVENRRSEKLQNDDFDSEGKTVRETPPEQVHELDPPKADLNAFPDGGFQAWFCIAGGFCAIFSSFGWVNCKTPISRRYNSQHLSLTKITGIGVFQDYYQAHQLSSYSPSTVAWIPATESFMLFFFVGSL